MTRRFVLPGRAFTDTILMLAALAATIYSLNGVLNRDSFTVHTLKNAFGDPLPKRVVFWQSLDQKVLAAARKSGQENFVADLVDRRSPLQANREVAALFYARATYALWPRRMFVTDPSIVIVNGDHLSLAPVPRNPLWLADHHAGAIVEFRVQDISTSSGALLVPSDAER